MIRDEPEPRGTDPTVELRARPAAPPGEPPEGAAGSGRAPAPVLRRAGRFVLLERLGAGGMGVVYAAFDEKLERKVAIKLVAAHRGDEAAHERLLREAQAQARLSHPSVVTIYEVGALPEGGLFIAMELIKGQTLRAWQRGGGRTWREIVAVYAAAGEGLAAAHRAGIVHRDFKPDNVLLGDDGRVRVADFGLAFAAEAEAEVQAATAAATASSVREADIPAAAGSRPEVPTATATIAGTPGYMAPEQLAGRRARDSSAGETA